MGLGALLALLDRSGDSEALFVLDELDGTGRRIYLWTRNRRRESEWGGIGVWEPEAVEDDVRRVGWGGERALISIYRGTLPRAGVGAEMWMALWEAIVNVLVNDLYLLEVVH